MATASVASLGCWAALEISQAAVPRSPMSAAMAPAPRSVASSTRPDAGRAMARVRPIGASPPDVGPIRRGDRHDATATSIGRCQSNHTVAHGQKGRAVGRHHHGATDHEAPHGGQDALFGPAVEIGRGLVEEKERRIPEKGPSQGDPLPLPCRQPGSIGAERGLESLGQAGDDIVKPGVADGGPNGVVSGVGSAETHVVGDGPGEEVGALRDPGHPGSPRVRVEVGQIDTADGDRASRSGDQAEQNAEQAGLATAAGTGDRQHLTGLDAEGDVTECRQRAARVA